MKLEFPETDLVGCRFPTCTGRNGDVEVDSRTKEYVYRLLPNRPQPKLGDFVITSCVNGFQVCVVTSLNVPSTTFKNVAYIVGVVDAHAYMEQLERTRLKESLHKQLQAKKKELEELVTWDLLAEKSPEFKALLEAYQKL